MNVLLGMFCLVVASSAIANPDAISYLNLLSGSLSWTEMPKRTANNSINGLPIPLNIEITGDTSADQCVPSKGPYCYQLNTTESSLLNGKCRSGLSAQCEPTICSNITKDRPINEFVTSFKFVQRNGLASQSVQQCGLSAENNSLTFGRHLGDIANSSCNMFIDLSLLLVHQNITTAEGKGYTVSFSFYPDLGSLTAEPAQLLGISAVNKSGDPSASIQLYINQQGLINTTADGQHVFYHDELNSNIDSVDLVISPEGIVLFLNGEATLTIEANGGGIVNASIEFGSSSFRGEIQNVTVYNVSANSNEIYSKFSREPLARYLQEPQCSCSRQYGDSFSLLYARESPTTPSLADCRSYASDHFHTGRRYTGTSHDKWAIFTEEGWISDFTNQAQLLINMPPSMLTYALSGMFHCVHNKSVPLCKRPKSMEVGINKVGGVLVYVSDDCLLEYGIPRTRLQAESSRTKRQTAQPVATKCYNWNDVASYLWLCNEARFLYSWYVPLIGPNEVAEYLNDAFIGDVSVMFKGQQFDSDGKKTNWYHVSQLTLYSQPHCGGHGSQLVGEPTTMSEYYNFFKPGTKAYECECPDGIQGDRCQSCADVGGLYRYKKGPNECADCACSDLARSAQCDRETGQCDCQGDVDDQLAGRQCYWYISIISPLYGPVAGGTKIIVEGGHFTGYGIKFDVYFNRALVHEHPSNTKNATIAFKAPASTAGESWVGVRLVASAKNHLQIGPSTKFYDFQYRPNPKLMDINPRTTILSGGTVLTVTGKYLDSVASPFMTIFIRQMGQIFDSFKTPCSVINGTVMYCRVNNLRPATEPLLLGVEKATPTHHELTKALSTKPLPATIKQTTMEATEPTNFTTTDPGNMTTTGDLNALKLTNMTTTAAITRTTEAPTTTNTIELSSTRHLSHMRRDRSRVERNSFPAGINKNYLNGIRQVEFTVGFIFDGFDDYADLKNSDDPVIRNLAALYVFDDPELTAFDQIKEYHPDDITIKIYGKRLDYSLSDKDYKVTIGLNGICTITSLQTNQLVCQPPKTQPEVDVTNSETYKGKKIPHIQVEYASEKFVAGYIYYKTNFWNDNPEARIAIIVGSIAFCLIVIGVVICCVVKKSRNKKQRSAELRDDTEMTVHYVDFLGTKGKHMLFPSKKLDPNIQANVDRCRIPAEHLKLGKQLGKGNFGAVFKGQLITPSGNLRTVAVKTIKEDKEMSFEDMENFLAEGTLMIDFKHENVLSLIGVVSEDGERPLVVLPYMENGDLCSLVRKGNSVFALADLLHFSMQIANGMAYLAKERFVHRDLAARNCMVDGSYIVKIADFGMSRDVYEKDYYTMDNMNKPLPMKWMAVESLKEGRFTSMSDVWSYGITMWELLTRGSSPYPGVNNYHIKHYVSTGKRLDKPSICPPIIYELMCTCWEEVPQDRPTFPQIADYIKKLLDGSQAPAAGSDVAAGYDYTRSATRNIVEDYLLPKATDETDDYIMPASRNDYVEMSNLAESPHY